MAELSEGADLMQLVLSQRSHADQLRAAEEFDELAFAALPAGAQPFLIAFNAATPEDEERHARARRELLASLKTTHPASRSPHRRRRRR